MQLGDFFFLPDQKEDGTKLGWECLAPTLGNPHCFAFGKVFSPQGEVYDQGWKFWWCWVLFLPCSRFPLSLHNGRGFLQEHMLGPCSSVFLPSRTVCAQHQLVSFLQVSSPVSGWFAFCCHWDVNHLSQQSFSLQNFFCTLNSLVDLRRACFHFVRHLFLWEQQRQHPST